ncbi:eukaryotic initiation factor 2A [Tribonema minus]|uniref:Eukaryotic translation initiation factor 2A n=1 Tax=Tribonema minus TaxID=303371 RepID=A0A836C9Y7_9STRA|nr:eukaryotic initiation factor 2A [Tribonema minus]
MSAAGSPTDADDGGSPVADAPPTKLLLRSKAGLEMLTGPPSNTRGRDDGDLAVTVATDESFPHVSADMVEWSKDGSLIAVATSEAVTVRRGDDGEVVCSLALPAKAMSFSPLGTYLLTWQNPAKTQDGEPRAPGNLVAWEVASGREVLRLSQKQLRQATWPSLQWTADESVAARATADQIQVTDNPTIGHSCLVKAADVPRLNGFSVAPGAAPFRVAAFVAEHKGKPARVTIYQVDRSDGSAAMVATASRSSFQAQEISFRWAPDGSALVGVVSTDLDATGQSYYGSSGIFLLHSDGSHDCAIAPPKEGAVHDVQWAPASSAGRRFAVCAGTMPTQTALYSAKGDQVFMFGTAHRNTLAWSAHGRFLCIAGFGNLAGEMDFWDTRRSKLLGSAASHCAVKYGWSPDSRYFMTATCAPRMNVDNGVHVFKYNGSGPVYSRAVDTLYDACWRPAAEGTYQDRAASPGRKGPDSKKAAAGGANSPTKPAAYRPPAARGGGSVAAMMRAEREGNVVGPGKVAKEVSSDAAAAAKQAEKEKKKERQQRKAAEKAKAEQEAREKAEADAAAAAAAARADPEKRRKALNKKLRQLEATKEKAARGEALDEGQRSALAREEELRQELASLGL